ncbi:hypothetical protein GDO81_025447 [Engystomops pustulosus]|uniref:Uncharacterized protein n=1 Tax=Engystomops pustulosus TaxID=76066 RepID=A0AAV6YHH4_ENGPU|nr:hypothetical protein GDO81_025447 [Engystomops pustulosus]
MNRCKCKEPKDKTTTRHQYRRRSGGETLHRATSKRRRFILKELTSIKVSRWSEYNRNIQSQRKSVHIHDTITRAENLDH